MRRPNIFTNDSPLGPQHQRLSAVLDLAIIKEMHHE